MTDQAIRRLHQKYAPARPVLDIVYTHSQIINAIVLELATKNHLTLDYQLMHSAILLHDIGYYPLLDSTGYLPKGVGIKHGVVGAQILRREGLPDTICRIAERHTGLGLTREYITAAHLPLPPRDLVAKTPEERLIMYADKFHTKSIGVDEPRDVLGWFNSSESYLKQAAGFGEDNARRFSDLVEEYGVPNLAALAAKYEQPIK